jgi:hypothetical protein
LSYVFYYPVPVVNQFHPTNTSHAKYTYINSISNKIMGQNKFFQEEQFYQISDNGIEVKSESNLSKISWSEVYKVTEYNKCFAILLSVTIEKVLILPKRSFHSVDDITDIKKIITMRVSKDKIKLS